MAALAVLLMMGCGRTSVQMVGEYGGTAKLPRPQRVLVYDFAVSPDEVKLNRGVGAKVSALLHKKQSAPAKERQLGRVVAGVLSGHLVEEIRKLGLQAERATAPPSTTGDVLVIEGQFLTIDEGDRLERTVIGLA